MMETATDRVAVVTGAGSGVGRAVALRLAAEGWNVGLVGRRAGPLAETIALAGGAARMLACPADVADPAAVDALARAVAERVGAVSLLVNAAGTNVPRRALEVLSPEDYRRMMETNLSGPYWCARAFLPAMRARQSGTIVNIVSDAALAASPKAGPAYVMSKFGLRGLTQAINAEERAHGVRACAILPGDVDTPLLDRRPTPPPPEARRRMLRPEDVAACVMLAVNLPARATVEELLVRPT